MKKKISLVILLSLVLSFIAINKFHTKYKFISNIRWSAHKYLKEKIPEGLYVFIRLIGNNKIITLRTLNDYNVKFLPETQTTDLKFKKTAIPYLKKTEQGYYFKNQLYSYYFARYKKNLFIGSTNGEIFFLNFKNSNIEGKSFKKINHNLSNFKFSIRDIMIDENYLYLSTINNSKNDCRFYQIYKAKINFSEKLNFKIIFSNKECAKSVQGGKIQKFIFNNEKSILLTTAADVWVKDTSEEDLKPQDDLSIYGKVLAINEKTGEHIIFSKGHRNPIGLYFDSQNNIILSTENGPKGGDEINLIKYKKNYGWNVASYGTKYLPKFRDDGFPDYKSNHADYNFEEPVFAFVPSIGISEIIKLDNNFQEEWVDNYLFGSLYSRHLYRIKFDKSFSKIFFYEKIFIGERIRDLIYLEDEKKILLALEETGSIGIITIDNVKNQ